MINKQSHKNKHPFLNRENLYTLFLCLVWGKGLLVYTRTFIVNTPLDILAPIIDSIILLLCVPIALKRLLQQIKVQDIIFITSVVIIYLFKYILFPQNSMILTELISVCLFGSLPLYLIGIQIDITKLQKAFQKTSIVVVVFCLFYSLIYSQRVHGALDSNADEMGIAYFITPHVVFLLWQTLKKFNWITFISLFIGVLLILSYGTRGPLVCLCIWLIAYTLIVTNFRSKLLLTAIMIMIACAFYLYSNSILNFLFDFLPSIGMSNRIIEKIMTDSFIGYEHSSERDTILIQLWSALQQSHFNGYGIHGTWAISGGYAHNILFDFWISFGIIWGSILMLTILILFLRAFNTCKSEDEKALLLLLFTFGFFKLFLSNLYLKEPYFWLLIGYCVYLIRNKYNVYESN